MGVLTLSLLCVLLAQDRPKVAVHPLEIQAERREADLGIRFTQEVLQRRMSSVESRQIPAWLAKQPKASCLGQTDCLKRMAEAMGATYALYASLVVSEQNYQISGKVVRSDGEVVRHVDLLSYPKNTQQHGAEDVQRVFRALLDELRPETLPTKPWAEAEEEGAAVKGAAAKEEEGAAEEEEVSVMELDFQESEDEPTKAGLRRSASLRKGMYTSATRWVSSKNASLKNVPQLLEPLAGWAPPSSAWARPRYMELHNKPAPLRTTAYVMTGASGATLLTGGIFGLMGQSKKRFLEKNAPNAVVNPGVSLEKIWAAHKKAELYPQVGAYLAGTGLAFAGAAATLFILSHVFEEGMPFTLAPVPGGMSLGFQKSF